MEISEEELDGYFDHMIEFKREHDGGNKKPNTCSETCVSCGDVLGMKRDTTNGSIVCTTCGVIQESSIIDDSAEWSYGPDAAERGKDPSRCGCPVNPLLEKSSMSTIIGKGGGNKFWLMKKIHQQNSMDYSERARWHVFEDIAMKCGRVDLPQTVVNQAKYYYKILSEKKLSRGGVRKGLIACCIKYACLSFNVSRSVKEIAKICETDTSKITSASKIFEEIMDGHITRNVEDSDVKHVSSDDLVIRFCFMLDLERKTKAKLVRDVKKACVIVNDLRILVGKTPSAVTSAVILYVIKKHGLDINKKELVRQHNVSLVTLNKIGVILEQHSDYIKID